MVACTYNCLMSVINIGNSIIGVSILAMPYCFRKCGILLSLVLIMISGLLTKLACFLLLKSAVMARRRSFEFLAFHTFGSYGKLAVEMGVIGFLIGVCIAFFVVIGDLGPPLAAEFLNIENAPNLRTNVLMLVGICVALPLGLLRKIDSLTSLSALSIAFYVCLILKIFAEAVPNLAENDWWHEVNWWRSEGILPCLPIFSMALSCQTQLFEFFDTTNDPSVKRMQSVIDGAVCLCSVVYIMVGIFGYIAFHDKNITGNILIFLTPSVITEFIKLGFILTVAVSFPLCLFPCRSSLHSLIFKQGFVHHDINVNIIPDHRFRILTVSLVIITIGIAIMLPNIEFVLGIIGSTIGTLICLILPAMIFINDSNKITSERRKAQVLFGIGTFILVACTFSTLQENRSRTETVPIEVSVIQKITPVPLLLISSASPEVIQSPKIMLKEEPAIQMEKKIETSDPKISDNQKRLEPPIPQEPEVKIEQNGDLDPQALQKEDKELQKESSHPSPNSADSAKKDEGLEKQEQLLQRLEEQNIKQEKLIEEQKMVLKELKQHKESHEELKKSELLEKQNIKQELIIEEQNKELKEFKDKESHGELEKSDLLEKQGKKLFSTPSPVKVADVKKETGINVPEMARLNTNMNKKAVNEYANQKETLLKVKPESLITVATKNSSSGIIPNQNMLNKLEENHHKNELEGIDVKKNIIPGKQSIINNKLNETFFDIKHKVQNIHQNLSSNVPKSGTNILNIPVLSKKDVPKPSSPENVETGMHVKSRETLAKKVDLDVTVSLPKQDINRNSLVQSDKEGT